MYLQFLNKIYILDLKKKKSQTSLGRRSRKEFFCFPPYRSLLSFSLSHSLFLSSTSIIIIIEFSLYSNIEEIIRINLFMNLKMRKKHITWSLTSLFHSLLLSTGWTFYSFIHSYYLMQLLILLVLYLQIHLI
jgi:hypothetical protein